MKKPTKNAQEILAVRCDARIVAAIDEIATRQFRSRSDIVRQSILKELSAQGLCPVAA
jgi:predicted transcriptional regulator